MARRLDFIPLCGLGILEGLEQDSHRIHCVFLKACSGRCVDGGREGTMWIRDVGGRVQAERRVAWTREAETEMQIHENFRTFVGGGADRTCQPNVKERRTQGSQQLSRLGGQTVALVGTARSGSYGNFKRPVSHLFLNILSFSLTFASICLN